MGPTKAMESTDKTRKMRGPTLQIGEESKKKLEKIRKNEEKRPKIRNKKSKFNKRAGFN